MPICFELQRENGIAFDWMLVDEGIAKILNVPVHTEKWAGNWMNRLGIALASGRTREECHANWDGYPDDEIHLIIDHIFDDYVVYCWRE